MWQLHKLDEIVRSSRCLVFVLSENILSSKWCLFELRSGEDELHFFFVSL